MTVIAVVEALALIAVVLGFLHYRDGEQQAWAGERRELLNRIAHPEFVPTQPVAAYPTFVEPEPDEIDKVGTIEFVE
jgi:hypothetical protein